MSHDHLPAPRFPTSALQLEVRREDGRVVVAVAGELDIHSAPVLRGTFQTLLEEDPQEILVDLRALTFLGSTGLHLFDELSRGGREVRFVASSHPGVTAAFRYVGLAEQLRFVDLSA